MNDFFNDDDLITMFCISQEQFQKLSETEKSLYHKIQEISFFQELLSRGCYGDYNVITNFGVNLNSRGRQVVTFDIVDSTSYLRNPNILYKVNGSFVENSDMKSFIFQIFSVFEDKVFKKELRYFKTLSHTITNVTKDISFMEDHIISIEANRVVPIRAVLKLVRDIIEDEVIEIEVPTDGKLYRLYQTGKLDLMTFSNFVIMQSEVNDDTKVINSKVGITKKILSRKFKNINFNDKV